MTDALQIGIVTGAAGVALLALVLPLIRKRPRQASPGSPPCARCAAHAQPVRRR